MAGQLRVDEITDEAGTGSPDFINGIQVEGTQFTSSTLGGNYIQQVYNAPATWDKPAGLKAVKVTVVSGGGGSGGIRTSSLTRSGGNGGGGGYAELFIPAASIPGPVTVTYGAGGAAGVIPGSNNTSSSGGAGGTSSFGSFVSATGGGGSIGSPLSGVPGAGGVATSGDINIPGSLQRSFLSSGAPAPPAGGGGPGVAGLLYGVGATGAVGPGANAPQAFPGAVGGGGIVIVEEFY
jgi:hypothetical protein